MIDLSRTFNNAPDRLRVFERPRKDCKRTETMDAVLRTMQVQDNKIMHIHGMPGSGKSQTVALICEEMEAKGFIVWHVQCQQGQQKIKYGWQELGRRLRFKDYISHQGLNDMFNALETPNAATMTRFLSVFSSESLPFHILLAVELEDADYKNSWESSANDALMLRAFVESLSTEHTKVQLLVASRFDDILFSKATQISMQLYKTYEIRGFTKQEAISFLETDEIQHSPDKLRKLADELSYSPLGLLMAKCYCLEFSVSYDYYYDSLGKNEFITEKEKSMLKTYPDLGKNHRYEIIMKLLCPKEQSAEDHKEFRVMQMLAFLNKNKIPSQILESFFRQSGLKKPSEINTATTHLTRKLEKRVDAIWDKTEGNESISLHGDILRVLQFSIKPEDKFKILSDVVFGLTSILDKDNRTQRSYGALYELKNHTVAVVCHCSEHFQPVQKDGKLSVKDYEIFLSLSRINELIGFAISQHPGERATNDEDRYFEKALEYLWGVVTIRSNDFTFANLLNRVRGRHVSMPDKLITYQPNKDPEETAAQVYRISKQSVKDNKELFQALQNDYLRSFPLKIHHVSDMEKVTANQADIDWDKIREEIRDKGEVSDLRTQQMVRGKAILDWKDLSKFYVAERMASILHSRGRQDNYKRDLLNEDMIERCKWWVDFGYQLCDVAFKKTGFKSLFHFVIRANNKLHKLSMNRTNESDEDFDQRIREVREMVTGILRENSAFYEHGKCRLVSGTPWTEMSASKYLVKVNTKVHKRPALLHNYPLSEADEEAEKLYKLACDNPSIVIGTTCLVHVGKYFSARKKFPRAFEVFEKAFENGIERDAAKNATRFAWALYNEYRALLEAGKDFHDERLLRDLQRRYDVTKNNGTPQAWAERLSTIRTNVPTSGVP